MTLLSNNYDFKTKIAFKIKLLFAESINTCSRRFKARQTKTRLKYTGNIYWEHDIKINKR